MADALFGKTRQQLETIAAEFGAQPYRGRQLYTSLYDRGVTRFEEMTDLSKRFRESLADDFVIGRDAPASVSESADGTKKYLFPTQHGGFVEAALIPDGKRVTLCLSTQVGCRRSCTFCQTARQGFQGNLNAGEILNQYFGLPEREEVTNIVYMGMGEPLDNLDATLTSLALLTDPEGAALSPRRITVSTVGILPAVVEFLDRSSANLAVSVHTPFPDERRRIMPVENANPILETIRLIRERREDKRRKVTVEYTLFDGINDTERHARELARLFGDLSVRINLIPFHKIPTAPYEPTPAEQRARFRDWLREKGMRAFVRRSRGQDIHAACGMLWTRHVRSQTPAAAIRPTETP